MSGERWAKVTFREVALCFGQEAWALVGEEKKDVYRKVLKDIHRSLTQLGFSIVSAAVLSVSVKQEDVTTVKTAPCTEKEEGSDPFHPDLLFWIKQEEDSQSTDMNVTSRGAGRIQVKTSGQLPDQTSMTFQEVAVCFCQTEWTSFEDRTKNLYREVLQDIHRTLTQLGHIILNPKTFIRMREKEEQRERGLQGNKKCENGSHPDSKNFELNIKIKEEEYSDCDAASGSQSGDGENSSQAGGNDMEARVIKEDEMESVAPSNYDAWHPVDNFIIGVPRVANKRGRPPLYTPETARKRRLLTQKTLKMTRISIGKAFQDWKALKTELDLSHEDMALFLINTYRKYTGGTIGNVTVAGTQVTLGQDFTENSVDVKNAMDTEQMEGVPRVANKRGRPPLYSPETARKRRVLAEKTRQTTRISIGKAFQDWKALKTQMGLSNEDMALFLMKTYRSASDRGILRHSGVFE
ncbi:uncharacterized protein LOC142487994 isoform X2 [Ascaphus truei]|uniref:uncharacterized protein LOC142487994 isoform X2 n=1 Tax=Ascaphus truei TaxID=8439 RepID=UPI003F5AA9CC